MSEDFSENEENEVSELVFRFEQMLRNDNSLFFDVEEYEEIIDYYLDINDLKKSGLAISRASEQHPYHHAFLIRKARLIAGSGKPDKALDLLNQLEKPYGKEIDLIFTRAGVYSMMKQHQKAVDEYLSLIEFYEEPGEIYTNIAFEYENMGNYNKAVAYLKKALECEPENDMLLYELGYCFEVINRTEDSVKFFLNYIDQNPYSDVAWFNLGIAYSNLELYE